MSKYTTTIEEIIRSELNNRCFNEFFNNGQITAFNKDYSFIQKMIKFDSDVKSIVDEMFFLNFKFDDETIDFKFKKMFVDRFLNREIKYQTVEAFASRLIYYVMAHEDYIRYVFTEIENYLTGKSTSQDNSNNHEKAMNEYRALSSILPQTEVNMNVDNDNMDYADNNTISKTKDEKDADAESHNQSNSYDLNVLQEIYNMRNLIFMDIDKECFLQVW